jgi:RNA polymerase sigma-70 factor (ECF subfamily)
MSSSTLEALLAERAWVQRLARKLVADTHRADDVAQSVWLSVLRRPPRHAENLRSWLASLVLGTARTMARGESRRGKRESVSYRERGLEPKRAPESDQPERVVERAELVRELVTAVLALRDPYRIAILLTYFEGLTPSEAAERLKLPASTVRSHLKRGLELLRSELEREFSCHERGGRDAWCAAFVSFANEPTRGSSPISAGPRNGTLNVGNPVGRFGTAVGTLVVAMKTKLAIAAVVLFALGLIVWSRHPVVDQRPAIEAPKAVRAESLESSPLASTPESAARESLVPSTVAQPLSAPQASANDGSLRVEVVWERDGSPASGVGVLVGQTDDSGWTFDSEYTTGTDGSLLADHLAPGHARILVDRGGIGHGRIEAGKQDLQRVAIPNGVHVRGRVIDSDSRILADAVIELSYSSSANRAHEIARSGSDGLFEIDSVEVKTSISARKPGWAPSFTQEIEGCVGDTVEIELVLPGRGGSLQGRVIGPEAKPIACASVSIGPLHRYAVSLPNERRGTVPNMQHASTDADGRFHVDGLALGENSVVVDAIGFPRCTSQATVRDQECADLELHLEPGAVVRGVVSDPDGLPASNVTIEIQDTKLGVRARTRSGATGSYVVERLPAGKYTAVADGGSRGRLRATIEAKVGEDLVWNAKLDLGIVLGGRVIDERDQPLAGWLVWTKPTKERFTEAEFRTRSEWPTGWGETKTDADGRFLLCNLLDWKCQIEIRSPPPPIGQPLIVLDDVTPGVRELLIRVRDSDAPRSFVHGVVADEDGAPIGDAELVLFRVPFHQSASATVEQSDRATGVFRMGPLPAGEYRITVRSPGFVTREVPAENIARSQDFDYGVLRMQSAGAVCVKLGHVGSGPIAGVDVWAYDEARKSHHLLLFGDRARSDNLAPGRYRLEVRGEDGKRCVNFLPFEIVKGQQTDLEVELPRAQR